MTTTTTADPRTLETLIEYFKTVPLRMRRSTLNAMESRLPDDASSRLKYHWPLWARENQVPSDDLWRIWLLLAGRGFGKTRAEANN